MNERLDKLLSALSISFLAAALIMILVAGPSSGYEIDIYAVYPTYFWLLLAMVYLLSSILVLDRVLFKSNGRYWIIGVLLIVCANSIVLLIPIFRGYFFYGTTDAAQCYGLMKDIKMYGNIGVQAAQQSSTTYSPIQDIYPAFPILIVATSYLTGSDLKLLSMLAPCFFFLFYQFSIFVLARSLTHSFRKALLALAFAFPFLFLYLQSMATPTVLLFLYSPFVIFIAHAWLTPERQKLSLAILTVIVLMSIPIAHPADAISILTMLILLEIILRRNRVRIMRFRSPSIILAIVWFIWISSFGVFSQSVYAVFHSNLFELSPYITTLNRAHAPILDVITIFLKGWGQNLEYFIVSGTILIILVMSLRRKKLSSTYAFISIVFIVFLVLTPVFTLIPTIGGYRRVLYYAVFASTLLNAFYCYDCFARIRRKKAFFIFLTLIIFSSIVLGILNVHYSPFTRGSNHQITYMDAQGMSWFLAHNNGQNLIDQIRVQQYALSAINIGDRQTPKNIRWGTSEQYQALDHFGYGTYYQYGNAFNEDRYFIGDKLDRILLPTVFPDYRNSWRWNEEDWTRFESSDASALRVYNNNEFVTYYIRGNIS